MARTQATATIAILTIPAQRAEAWFLNTRDRHWPTRRTRITSNNTSTHEIETITAPTQNHAQVVLGSSSPPIRTAQTAASFLTWKTAGEAHNLGFNVYRDQNGNRARMNPSIIAGSALLDESGAVAETRGPAPTHGSIPPLVLPARPTGWKTLT